MAFTSTDIDNIDKAIATGELSVEVDGRKVIYRSVDQLIRARGVIAEVIAHAQRAATGTSRTAYRVTFATHRGD